MASASASLDFHASFQADKRSILALFEADPPAASGIAARLQALRGRLTENLAFLPAYDRRSYDLQLKELESKLSQLRAKDKPKSRFAFSSAKPGPSSSSSSSTLIPTSSPVPPPDNHTIGTSGAGAASTAIHVISNRSGTVIRPSSDAQDGYTLSLESVEGCIIDLRSADGTTKITSLHAKGLRRCVLLAPVMDGSAILDGVEECLVVLGAQQFRIHNSSRTTILLHVPSNPIIEHCTSLHFGAYPTFLSAHGSISKHDQVQDFDWIREGRSPNWVPIGETASGMLFTGEHAVAVADLTEDTSGREIDELLEQLLSSPSSIQPDTS